MFFFRQVCQDLNGENDDQPMEFCWICSDPRETPVSMIQKPIYGIDWNSNWNPYLYSAATYFFLQIVNIVMSDFCLVSLALHGYRPSQLHGVWSRWSIGAARGMVEIGVPGELSTS